ncbi:MAG TPA: penicillin-binding protein activator [Allosphingosinicella sp.]|jgi:ABC-type branched-subunit amino acid transport system substrate-binding protein|uniref:penicillin-binding protein activator n=1 Tax=Allosphingosinicella sp. TaxID=2823234 RepID=UPI002F283E9F
MAERVKSGQARRWVLKGATLGFAMLLGGCEIVPDPAAPQTSAQAAPAATVTQPSAAAPVPVANREAQRNQVALLVPLTGPNAGIGQSIANAATLALTDSGTERIRISVYDTAGGAAAAANQALAEGNRLFLGPLLAEDVRAVAPLARAARAPVIAFSNDASVARSGVYLMGFVPAQSIERVVAYARGQGVHRFGGLVPTGVYGERARQAFTSAVQRAGGQVTAIQSYDRTPASARAAAGRLNAQGAYDAVLIADTSRIAAAVAPAIRRNARILGTELWGTETNLVAQRPLHGAWFAAAPGGMFEPLSSRYRSRFGNDPYRLASLGYDAVLMTVRITAEWPSGQPLPERVLRTQIFTGIDGPFRFWSDGVADRSLEVQEVGPGGVRTVSAALQDPN